ncbi:hypothetical protein [Algoriphagus sp.]|uniref:hypothetical protein n=1 Tax=Algoriphagus sp. TaxID=1872435 RepID=UPI00391D5338
MASRSYSLLLLLLIFSTLISCEPKEEVTPAPDPFPSLTIFKDRFLAEAKARGYNLDMSGLDMQYVDGKITPPDGREYCGYGWINFPVSGRRQIFISKDPSCGYANYTDIRREIFVFHEIGHAFLNLRHDNSFLCDGRPLSLMHENVHMYDYYEDTPENKKYYLDELFDRLAAEEKCIKYAKDYTVSPVFFSPQASGQNWVFSNSQGSFTGERITNSTPNALVISSVPGRTSTSTGYWFSQIENANIPKDAKVTLRTKVTSTGLTGPGVAIAIRVYENTLLERGSQLLETMVLTTENKPVSGVLDGQILELSIPKFNRKMVMLIPFAVMMPGTEGVAIFEDFEIIVEK